MRSPMAIMFALAVGWVLTVFVSSAFAHSLGVQCRIEDAQMRVAAFFDDKTDAANAKVRVENLAGESVAEGRTDRTGRFVCPRPGPGKYAVIVDAGGGHRARTVVEIPQVEAGTIPRIEAGPNREEFTTFPWLKVAIGVATIFGFCFVWWLVRRGRSIGRKER